MKTILSILLLACACAWGANPSFNDFNTDQFSSVVGSKISIKPQALITNIDDPPTLINTSTGAVFFQLTYPGVLIKTNATYNLTLYANGVTNVISGDPVWIDVKRYGTNYWVRY